VVYFSTAETTRNYLLRDRFSVVTFHCKTTWNFLLKDKFSVVLLSTAETLELLLRYHTTGKN